MSVAGQLVMLPVFVGSLQEKVRLRYKLAFTLGDRPCNEAGEVDQFPPQEAWGHL